LRRQPKAATLPKSHARRKTLGYESLFIPEHPVVPIGFKTPTLGGGKLPEHYGRWMDPLVGLAVAAGVTNNIKLRVEKILRNLRNLLQLGSVPALR